MLVTPRFTSTAISWLSATAAAVSLSCAAPAATPATEPAAEPAPTGTRLYIVGDGVRMRAGPSTKHEIIGVLNRGAPVNVVSGSGSWCAIVHQADTVWVHANLVGPLQEAQNRE